MILRFFRRKSAPDVQMEQGLEKTRRGVFSEITRLFERGALDDELYEELEMLLIQADVGWDVSQKLVGDLRARVKREMATFVTTGPNTGALSLTLSNTRRPPFVRMINIKQIHTTIATAMVIMRWSLIASLMPSTNRVNAGSCAPSNMPANTSLNFGTTITIKIIKIAVATTSTAQG